MTNSRRITTDEYDDLVIKEKQLQKDLNLQMSDHTDADESFLINVSYLLDLSNRAAELFEVSEVQQKRQLLNFLLSNCKLEGEKLLFDLKQPFDALYNASKTQSWLPSSLELRTLLEDSTYWAEIEALLPVPYKLGR